MNPVLKQTIEIPIFGGAAVMLLLACFAALPEKGLQSGGAGGEGRATVAAATATVTEMVQRWQQPLQVQTSTATAMDTRDLTSDTAAPLLPQFELAQAPKAMAQIGLPPTSLETDPVLEVAAPSPPPVQPKIKDVAPPELRALVAPALRPDVQPKPETLVQPVLQPDRLEQPEAEAPVQPVAPPEPAVEPDPEPATEPASPPPAEPTREAEQVSASRAAQQAAGSGGSKEAGNSTAAVTTSSESASKNTQLGEIWRARIQNRILRAHRYPRRASGTAKVAIKITIAPSGQLLSHRLVRSSGEAVFDNAALRTIASIRRFPKAPRGYTGGQSRFNATMDFTR